MKNQSKLWFAAGIIWMVAFFGQLACRNWALAGLNLAVAVISFHIALKSD